MTRNVYTRKCDQLIIDKKWILI